MKDVEWQMQAVIDLISRVRNIRSEMNIKPGEAVPSIIGASDSALRSVFIANRTQIKRLARAGEVSISERTRGAACFCSGCVGRRRRGGCATGGFD